jgi:hypothetical protein
MIKQNATFITYYNFEQELTIHPFIIIIGKYDHVLGPREIFSTTELKDDNFGRNLLRDALNTKSKYVILDFDHFYSQVCKIDVEDKSARGGKQLYALILLRDVEYPLIPIMHLQRMELIFTKIGADEILKDDPGVFERFARDINDIYLRKDAILPVEETNLQIRSGVNTIQGFCELILEDVKDGATTDVDLVSYIEIMIDSCKEIMDALDIPLTSATK